MTTLTSVIGDVWRGFNSMGLPAARSNGAPAAVVCSRENLFLLTNPKPTAERSPVAGWRVFLATSAGCSDVTSIKHRRADGEQRRLTT